MNFFDKDKTVDRKTIFAGSTRGRIKSDDPNCSTSNNRRETQEKTTNYVDPHKIENDRRLVEV